VRLVFFGVLVTSLAASAQVPSSASLAVTVMDARELSEANVRKLHRAALEQLKALVAVPVSDAYDWKGPKRACAETDLGCQRDKVKAAGAPAAIALWVTANKLTAVLFLDGDRIPPSRDVELGDAPDVAARTLFDGLVPAWMKKGWGAIRLSDEPAQGSVVKVDGRVLPAKDRKGGVIPLTAGAHQLDLVFPDGRAVLQRVEVAEGSRTRVDVEPPAGVAPGAATSAFSAVRLVSYSAWMVGTATLLSAFIVAFVGRQTAVGQSPCRPDTRECSTLSEAMERQRQAAGYASTANVLLALGLVFSGAGAGLFTFDVLR
jgi:hypothetical protein